MKRFIPVLGAALLIVLLVFVNKAISHTARPDADDDETAQSTPQKTPKPAAPAAPAGPSIELPSEITIGDPATAKHRITVGWIYDEADQVSPQTLNTVLQIIEQNAQDSHGATSAEIVDLDVPPADRSPAGAAITSLGIFIDGGAVGPPGNPGGPGLTPDVIAQVLHGR